MLNECVRVMQDFTHFRDSFRKEFQFFIKSLQLKFKQNCLESSNSAIQTTGLGEQAGC